MTKMQEIIKVAETTNPNNILPWQHEIKAPAYFIRLWAPEPNCDILVIYGRVVEPEYEEDRQLLLSSPRLRDSRMSWCYSEMETEGEPGNIHVSMMHAILTKAQFEFAQSVGFPSDPGAVEQILSSNFN
jgi:hypothetical protein